MLKLIKYELRRNITGIVILLSVILLLQGYFMFSVLTQNKENTAIATALLLITLSVSYFCVFIFGVSFYSKELNSKSSYLTFMTPTSSYSIIGAKLLSTLITGIFFAMILVTFISLDMVMLKDVFPELSIVGDIVDVISQMSGVSMTKIWLQVLLAVIAFLVDFFAIIAMAYMAITLSATWFQNKRFKGVISFILFIAIIRVVNFIGEFVPNLIDEIDSLSDVLITMIPTVIYLSVVIIFAVIASAKLLDKKVSL